MRTIMGAATAIALAAAPASAAIIAFVPGDRPVAVGTAFGPVAEVVGAAFTDFGVDFTPGNDEGIFDDPPLAFGGVNAAGEVDLVTDVDGRIVVPGTLTASVTSYFYAEAGDAATGSLTLSVFDTDGNLLASVPNGPSTGANGNTTFEITRAIADIASFRISGADTYGVNEIRLETPGGDVPVPAPGALALFGLGLAGLALSRRKV
jgi:hypothetical protein